MDDVLIKLLSELEHVGKANDAKTSDRSRCMLNITRDTGEFLTVLVRATASRRVLEIGTSNGYSTMWLAEAARSIGGSVTTIESDEFKIELARANFARSGMSPFIRLVHEDATRFLEQNEPGTHDLVFLDADRSRYPEWWPYLSRAIRPGGLMVVDNATTHADQMAPFVTLVATDKDFETCEVPIGNGEFLAVKCSEMSR